MPLHPFYTFSIWLVFVITSLALALAALAGFLIGWVASSRVADKSQLGAIQASILGMLALLLGFTFEIASSRYDARRLLAVDEANALGTTFMRAQTLPEPYRTSISDMLRRYVDLRLRMVPVLGDPGRLAETRRKTEALQQAIWKQATLVARSNPTPITAVFLTTLNESIDLYSSRVAAYWARVPCTILWILSLIALASLGIVGYGFGLTGQRSWLVMALVCVLVSAVIVMIVDLDEPQSGPTRISQQSMVDLQSGLSGFELRSP